VAVGAGFGRSGPYLVAGSIQQQTGACPAALPCNVHGRLSDDDDRTRGGCKEGAFRTHRHLMAFACPVVFVDAHASLSVSQCARPGTSHPMMMGPAQGARKAPSRPTRVTQRVSHVPGQRSLRKLAASLLTHAVSPEG
jgi:hypothetical protein